MQTRPHTQASHALRRSATVAVLLVLLSTAAIASALAVIWPLSPWFVPKALALPLFWFAIVMPKLSEHGHPSLGPANTITLARGTLTALTAAFAYEPFAGELAWGLVIAAWAAFTLDWADGRVARRTGTCSPFGARLDMELDALAVLSLCALAHGLGRAPSWVYLSGALRYLFVAASFLWPWMDRPLFPAKRRAFVCGVQITCLVAALVPWDSFSPVRGLSLLAAAIGTASLVWSFALDTWWLVSRRNDPLG